MIKPIKPIEPVMPEERISQDKIEIPVTKPLALPEILKLDLKKATKSSNLKNVIIEGNFEFWGVRRDYGNALLVFTGGKFSWENPNYQYAKPHYDRDIKTYPKRLQEYEEKLAKYEEWKANHDAKMKKTTIIKKEKEKRQLEERLAKITQELNESFQ